LESQENRHGERLLKPSEAAALFGVDRKSLVNWVRAGKLTAQRTMGGHRRYRETEVRTLIAGLKAAVS
jgi:excisionase family DNA binding protein